MAEVAYKSRHLRNTQDVHKSNALAFSREWMTPSEAAEKYVRIDRTGEPVKKYDFDVTPYSRKPLDTAASKRFEAVFFIAPQQSGKTQPLLALMAYFAFIQPANMMLVEKINTEARNFSRQRLDPTIRCSPAWAAMQTGLARDDTDFSKTYRNGVYHEITFPTINTLAGKPVRVVGITDYDRMSAIIGHGNVFQLAHKRSDTFGYGRMTFVESSPGFKVTEEKVDRETGELLALLPHEFPPCKGIGDLYNRGNRERWYWQCHSNRCKQWFLGTFDRLVYRNERGMDPGEVGETVRLECPHCGNLHDHKAKEDLNANGVWRGPRQSLDVDGKVSGESINTTMASYWLPGPCAYWQDWPSMVNKQIAAQKLYDETGDESDLETTALSDQAVPYIPQVRAKARTADALQARAEVFVKRRIPFGVRYLTAQCDVQKNRFDVLVQGWGKGRESWIIDRFRIANVEPEASLADWEKSITKEVIHRAYQLEGFKNRWMTIKCVACDSQGKSGVTTIAYDYWRTLLDEHLTDRFMLVRGKATGPQLMMTQPELTSQRQKTKNLQLNEARAAHSYQVNVNTAKDAVDKMLETAPDPEMEDNPLVLHFAKWLPNYMYPEITAEVRDVSGKWDHPGSYGTPNETLDLLAYGVAINWAIKGFQIDWSDPPPWADAWGNNSLIIDELQDYQLDATLID